MNVRKSRPKRKEQIRKQYPTELDVVTLTHQELLKMAQVLNIGLTDNMDAKTLTRAIAIATLKEEYPCK